MSEPAIFPVPDELRDMILCQEFVDRHVNFNPLFRTEIAMLAAGDG
jgi:hypothetical protein